MLHRSFLFLSVFLAFSINSYAQFGAKDYSSVGGHKSGSIVLGAFRAAGHHFIGGNHWDRSQVDSFKVLDTSTIYQS